MKRQCDLHPLLKQKAFTLMIGFVLTLSFATELLAQSSPVNYDIVYIRAPRDAENDSPKIQDVHNPIAVEPGTDLMLLHPNGTEEVLVAGGKGAVMDPYVSFDGKWVYYAKVHDQTVLNTSRQNGAVSGSDIFKINIQTRQVVQLTFQEWTPNKGLANWSSDPRSGNSNEAYLGYGIYNTGPCPLPGGKIMFTSSRNGYMPNKFVMFPNLQLFVMDEDGKNVEQIGYHNAGGALHPTVLKDGRVMFSSFEAQGLRFTRLWGLMSIYPDGRQASPLMSAFPGNNGLGNTNGAYHWQTQLSDGSIVVNEYYSEFNWGFGTLMKIPSAIPQGTIPFGSPNYQDNPFLKTGWFDDGRDATSQYPFMPFGMESLTPFTWGFDEASPFVNGNSNLGRAGKVSQPSGTSNNNLLLVWSPGRANSVARPEPEAVDAGLYLLTGGQPTQNADDLLPIKNDPDYNEQQPRAVLTYRQIYGIDEPATIPWLPNDGTLSPELPEGTPYGLVGTSSFYKRDTKPGISDPGFDGVDAFNTYSDATSQNWFLQGAEAGKYSSSDIYAVRILALEPTSHISYGPNHVPGFTRNFKVVGNERTRILGEIPLKKYDAQGKLVMDLEGNPDTSFLAKIPGDVPFTFQTIDKNGMVLNMSQTWHQVRPGEVRTDCGGCHSHSKQSLDFAQTAAAKPGYKVVDLANTTPLIVGDGQGWNGVYVSANKVEEVEYYRDVKPILQRSCVQCHSKNGPAEAGLILDDDAIVKGVDNTYNRLADDRKAQYGIPPLTAPFGWNQGNQSRYIRSYQSRRSLLMWKLYGKRLDGWTNADHPSASIPGDPNSLPNGGTPNEINRADIDYTGSIMPPSNSGVPPLTEVEKQFIARWIDLGTPISLPQSYFAQSNWYADEMRPTTFIASPRAGKNPAGWYKIRVSMHDYYTSVDFSNSEVSVNFPIPQWNFQAGDNLLPYFMPVGDGIYDFYMPEVFDNLQNGEITIRIKDKYGNVKEVKRSFSIGDPNNS